MSEEKKEINIKELQDKINLQQRAFCDIYTSPGEFFGNGTQAYIEAYSVDVTEKGAYAAARACASRLLTDANILAYIDALLEDGGLNDQHIDKTLLFLINQKSELGTALGAIKEYNALRQRITQKIKHSGDINLTVKDYGNDETEGNITEMV